MNTESKNLVVDRGIALHKMIRLLTIVTAGNGYLNFMGNEFGHPEWIDFPRQGNGWSYKYARRQWSLVDSPFLRYSHLNNWDKAMIGLFRENGLLALPPVKIWDKEGDHVLVVERGDYIFAFNFHPTDSFTDYGFPVEGSEYKCVLDSDSADFGGFGRLDDELSHFAIDGQLKLYMPSRTVTVFKKIA